MAKKDNKPNIRFGALKRIANLMQSNTDNLYKNTYFSDPSNKQQLIDLKSGIDDSTLVNENIPDMTYDENIVGEEEIVDINQIQHNRFYQFLI